jgi:hypothetical protein
MSGQGSPTVEELIDQATRDYNHSMEVASRVLGPTRHQELLRQVAEDRLLGSDSEGTEDLGDLDPKVLDSPTARTERTEGMEVEDCDLAVSDDSLSLYLKKSRFGLRFKSALEEMLRKLEPHAVMENPQAKEKVFSYKAKVKMTGEIKRQVAGLYDDLLEAVFTDKKISFKEPVKSAEAIKIERDVPCTCGMLVQVIQNCLHYNNKHTELLKDAISYEEEKAYHKFMVNKGTQSDRFLSPTRSVASSNSESKAPIRERSFSRGGARGRGKREDSNRRKMGDCNNNRSREKSRDRSRSSFKIDNRDRSRDSKKDSKDFDRGRPSFKKPSQPAQERLQAERRKMEEPSNRKLAEEVASKAKKEADRISAMLLAQKPGGPARRRAGDSALGADGQVDWSTCPDIKAPPGMEPIITVKAGLWDVVLKPKSD